MKSIKIFYIHETKSRWSAYVLLTEDPEESCGSYEEMRKYARMYALDRIEDEELSGVTVHEYKTSNINIYTIGNIDKYCTTCGCDHSDGLEKV